MTLHREHTPSAKGSALLRRPTWAWIALGGVLIAILTAVQVTITDPRVQVRWNQGVGSADGWQPNAGTSWAISLKRTSVGSSRTPQSTTPATSIVTR